MKRTLLSIALAFAVPAVSAADGAPAAAPPPPAHATDTAAARAELARLNAQMQDLSRRMADLSVQLGDVGPRAYAYRYIGEPDRAMLGVVLAADAKGVRIAAVTPDSAAARAGLHDGDLITGIDGSALAGDTPAQALADARARLADLKEGQEIRLVWQRGGKAQPDLALKAERRKAWNWAQAMTGGTGDPQPKDLNERVRADIERARRDAERAGHEAERNAERAARAQMTTERARALAENARRAARAAMPWWGLNLAPMNAELGRYFDVDRGALVLATDDEALPGLRAGDVITEVGAHSIARPEDALRALRDQPAGSKVPIKLVRERKLVALNVEAPAFKSIFTMPPPPVPPTPPSAPPAPPAPTLPAPPVAPIGD